MAEHTPGPWYAVLSNEMVASSAQRGKWYVETADEYPVADVGEDDRETAANARLIAAAPDLLTACEIATVFLAHLSLLPTEEPRTTILAAIAKAKGETE